MHHPSSPNEALPGVIVEPQERARRQQALLAKGPAYKPRTRHKLKDGTAQFTNRLIFESSPYLLQHAHNPVNWFAWGDEAFAEAKRLDRPVFLSIGYATCHWCHVMEEESFEDLEIARYLNEHYIPIKVDREERPDVDAVYMAAVQVMTGSGGWPMSVWLNAERKPFFGGTYFPARDGDRGNPTGFLSLLRRFVNIWEKEKHRVDEAGDHLAEAIAEQLAAAPPADAPEAKVLDAAFDAYVARYDPHMGGIRTRHKFPSQLPIRFLLRHYRRTGKQQALDMATHTLDKMADGGMYDHVGGGFHRYSTDTRWLVPHFEKMLYDNALLTLAYLEGWQVTQSPRYAQIVREILRYVQRDMTAPFGAFYSATDADSLNPQGEREEGYFFTWTPAELSAELGLERAKIATALWGVTAQGNFEGRNILNTARPFAEVAKELGLSEAALAKEVEAIKLTLYNARKERPAPLLDDKILTSWNGLMISAYAQAGLALGEPGYVDAAAKAARFILQEMRDGDRLFRTYRNGHAKLKAYLDDYAFLIAGLLDLFEATSDPAWLQEAIALDAVLTAHYADKNDGTFAGYFMTADDAEGLLVREKPAYDGAEPSGNSIQLLNLLRLDELTSDAKYAEQAQGTLKAFASTLNQQPVALSEMLLGLDFYTDRPKEIVVVAADRAAAAPLLKVLGRTFVPNRVLAVVAPSAVDTLAKLVPLVGEKIAQGGKPTAYVCENRVCKLPTTDPAVFEKQLRSVAKR